MSGAHIHLLVNHAPVFGAFFALALFVASYFWAPDVLRRTALVVLIGTALAAAASDLSGDSAADVVRGLPGVQRQLIRNHDDFAGKAFTVAGIIGVIALAMLVRARRTPVPASYGAIGLACAIIVTAMMAYTALLGGQIRHTEVRPGATAADASVIEPRPAGPPEQP